MHHCSLCIVKGMLRIMVCTSSAIPMHEHDCGIKTHPGADPGMKGCWDPEFEPSVEEIVDYPMISLWRFSQFAFSSELAFRAGGFPYSVEHMAGEGQPAQAARSNTVRVYGA